MVKPDLEIGSLQSYFYLKNLLKFWHEVKFSLGSHEGTSKNGTSQNGTSHNGTLQKGTLQNGTLQNGTLQNGTSHNDTASQNGTRCKFVRYKTVQLHNGKRYKTVQRCKTVRHRKRVFQPIG